jgi:hypothetical protein
MEAGVLSEGRNLNARKEKTSNGSTWKDFQSSSHLSGTLLGFLGSRIN